MSGFARARKRANTNTGTRGAPRVPRGAPNVGGVGGHLRAPISNGLSHAAVSWGDTIHESLQEVPKMTKRMAAAIAGLGLLATTMTACTTLAGAGLGAGAGAPVGAGTGDGAGKGPFIGTAVDAPPGPLYGATRQEKGAAAAGGLAPAPSGF